MLVNWIYWVASLQSDELLLVLGFLLLVDGQRYALTALGMALRDVFRFFTHGIFPGPLQVDPNYQPSVTVLIVGYNEAKTIQRTMHSAWTNRPGIELIVVDDGSTDGMARLAREYAGGRPGILVLERSDRGGKSAALNLGLAHATGEILVTIDADSRIDEHAIDRLIQPLKDPTVAAVSGSVIAWNPYTKLVTWLQAYEYRQTIFLNRMFLGRAGLLAIVSGAFGAFRTSVVRELGGWDVGPGEDGDLAIRIRGAGGRIVATPYSQCTTRVPEEWKRLFNQRCRWDRTVVTFECRKHSDLANPWKPGFRWSNLVVLVERWFFNIVCVYTFWLYGVWLLLAYDGHLPNLLLLLYLCGLCIELLQFIALLMYSNRPWEDLKLGAIMPLYPLYQVFLKFVDIIALNREIFLRDSSQDNFVPKKVRDVTWHW